jgi:hypothetical protein
MTPWVTTHAGGSRYTPMSKARGSALPPQPALFDRKFGAGGLHRLLATNQRLTGFGDYPQIKSSLKTPDRYKGSMLLPILPRSSRLAGV